MTSIASVAPPITNPLDFEVGEFHWVGACEVGPVTAGVGPQPNTLFNQPYNWEKRLLGWVVFGFVVLSPVVPLPLVELPVPPVVLPLPPVLPSVILPVELPVVLPPSIGGVGGAGAGATTSV
jgi:hypothetical protein